MVVLIVLVGFSGCVGGNETLANAPAPTTADATPVLADFAVLKDGNLTLPVNGSIPAEVDANLTFDGSASTGDNLSYAWDFGDETNATGAVATHAYAAPGAFNVTLTVSDGSQNSTARVTINATRGVPILVLTETKLFTGDLVVGPAINPVLDCTAPVSSGVYCQDHTITIAGVGPDGLPVVAKEVRVALTGTGGTHTFYVYFLKGTTSLGGTGESAGAEPQPDRSFSVTLDLEPGDYTVRVRLNIGAAASYSVTADVDYYTV